MKRKFPNESEINRLKAQFDGTFSDPAADKVPDSLLPQNIGKLLENAEHNQKKVIKYPVWQRYGAIAAAFLLVVAAFAILPNLPTTESITAPDFTAASVPNDGDEQTAGITNTVSIPAAITTSKETAGKDYSAVKKVFDTYTENQKNNYGYTGGGDMKAAAEGAASSPTLTAPQASATDNAGRNSSSSSTKNFSSTNVQVKGVDEADIIKTDGEYIYFVVNRYSGNSTVAIAKANDGELKKVWEYKSENHAISEIFLSEGKLILLMTPNNYYYKTFAAEFAPVSSATRVEIYNLADKTKPTLARSFEQEGSYSSSRVSNGKLLLVTCKYAYNYIYGVAKFDAEAVIPRTMDSVVSDKMVILPPDRCYIVPNTQSLSFGTVSTIDLKSDAPAQSVTVMGDINTIYANTENVYVTQNRYEYEERTGQYYGGTIAPDAKPAPAQTSSASAKTGAAQTTSTVTEYTYYVTTNSYTDITKIAYSGSLKVVATGTVKGNLCSQFAMDEFEGNLRVATNNWDYQNNNKQFNNFYVLDSNMKTIGKLEGLAEGENMYSVRFEGKKAYAVTYRQTDPFFVINLDNPAKPFVQGELKIPGFSQYLHPYADNLVIGFGMDAIEDTTGTTGLTMGFKVAIYDVSDPSNPKELSTYYIGDRGTYSDLSYDHKALLFDKEKNIIAFPISISKVKEGADIREYGTNVFTGYIVLGYDAQKGFYEKGRITHTTSSGSTSADSKEYRYDLNITRGMYIDDVIYTLSNSILAANKLSDYKEISRIEFETPQINYVDPVMPSTPDYVSSAVSKVY